MVILSLKMGYPLFKRTKTSLVLSYLAILGLNPIVGYTCTGYTLYSWTSMDINEHPSLWWTSKYWLVTMFSMVELLFSRWIPHFWTRLLLTQEPLWASPWRASHFDGGGEMRSSGDDGDRSGEFIQQNRCIHWAENLRPMFLAFGLLFLAKQQGFEFMANLWGSQWYISYTAWLGCRSGCCSKTKM